MPSSWSYSRVMDGRARRAGAASSPALRGAWSGRRGARRNVCAVGGSGREQQTRGSPPHRSPLTCAVAPKVEGLTRGQADLLLWSSDESDCAYLVHSMSPTKTAGKMPSRLHRGEWGRIRRSPVSSQFTNLTPASPKCCPHCEMGPKPSAGRGSKDTWARLTANGVFMTRRVK